MNDKKFRALIDIGCGLGPADGYIGLDIRKSSNAKIIAKLPNLPFKKESIEGFRARHVLEHFDSKDIINILRNAAYCLKVDGEFQIIVPHYSGQVAYHFDHKSFWSINSPQTLEIGGQHDELIGSHFNLSFLKLFWMRKEYKGRFPILVKFMNFIINRNKFLMERLAPLYGGIYEMEFRLTKIK